MYIREKCLFRNNFLEYLKSRSSYIIITGKINTQCSTETTTSEKNGWMDGWIYGWMDFTFEREMRRRWIHPSILLTAYPSRIVDNVRQHLHQHHHDGDKESPIYQHLCN